MRNENVDIWQWQSAEPNIDGEDGALKMMPTDRGINAQAISACRAMGNTVCNAEQHAQTVATRLDIARPVSMRTRSLRDFRPVDGVGDRLLTP